MLCHRSCFFSQACVEVRLSAAGLVAREFHVNAEAVKNIHDGLTGLRVERIDEACHEQLHSCHEYYFTACLIILVFGV